MFCTYKIAGHGKAFGVLYVRKSQIGPGIPERRTDINGQVRMGVFSDIGASLMSAIITVAVRDGTRFLGMIPCPGSSIEPRLDRL